MVSPRLDFGKHRGRRVCDVPTQYLRWVARECECVDPTLKAAVKDELRRRGEGVPGGGAGVGSTAGAVTDLPGLISRWYREVSLLYHPDRGGSTRDMQVVNDCVGRLRKLAGVG
jgi:hypothetical protein